MDLMRLDFNWQPVDLIEKHTSLIWTERYRDAGEFQLVTYDIEDTLAAMPLRNLVAIDESQEVMMIERHAIEEDDDGRSKLTVSGRSLEAFTKFRHAWRSFKQADLASGLVLWEILNMTSAACVKYLLDFCLINGSQWDVAYADKTKIALLTIQNSAPGGLVANNRRIDQAKNLYDVIMEILLEDDLGIRNLRPLGASTNLTMQIRGGVDRTATVIFDVNAGHFSKSSYLFSSEDYMSSVQGLAKGIKTAYYNTYTLANLPVSGTGLGYRDLVVYRDDYEVSNDSGPYVSMLAAEIAAKGRELDMVSMFDGEVSPDVPYEYNVDYFLGDKVLYVGNYKLSGALKVSEFIRVSDDQGVRAYPTLAQTI